MPNNCSIYGGTFHTGTVSHGTLRTQDLLRAFADELRRLLPFNGAAIALAAYDAADALDSQPDATTITKKARALHIRETADEILQDLTNALEEVAAAHGCHFGTLKGDGADFGFWPLEPPTYDESQGSDDMPKFSYQRTTHTR